MDVFVEKTIRNENSNRLDFKMRLKMACNWSIRMMKEPLMTTLRKEFIIIYVYDENIRSKNTMM